MIYCFDSVTAYGNDGTAVKTGAKARCHTDFHHISQPYALIEYGKIIQMIVTAENIFCVSRFFEHVKEAP